jgi:hypothetical protein
VVPVNSLFGIAVDVVVVTFIQENIQKVLVITDGDMFVIQLMF